MCGNEGGWGPARAAGAAPAGQCWLTGAWALQSTILRVWVKDHPIKPQSEESVSHAVLSVAPRHEVNFARAQGSRSKAKDNREARFLPNPQANWGPMPRAGSKRAREIAEQDAAAAAENGQKADATPGAAE